MNLDSKKITYLATKYETMQHVGLWNTDLTKDL